MTIALPAALQAFGTIRWTDVVDIAATALLVYSLLALIRGTRAVPILGGLLVLATVLGLAALAHLAVLAAVLKFLLLGTAVSLPIVFQPELRRALEQIGRGNLFATGDSNQEAAALVRSLDILAKAAVALSRARVGALIAIEQTTGLREFAESGTRLDALLSYDLLLSIFTPRTPLHDGAVIVKGKSIEAAACVLPLSENVTATSHLGTRHRAAIGLSEQTDAVVIVVSEQTGAISVVRGGQLSRELDDEARLRSVLFACCRPRRVRPPFRRTPRGSAPAAVDPVTERSEIA